MTHEEYISWTNTMLDELKLDPINRELAGTYMLSDRPDDSMLEGAAAQNFFDCINTRAVPAALNWLQMQRQENSQDTVVRFIRLCWAIGKSTAIFLLEDRYERRVTISEREVRIEALGEAKVAAMEAEKYVHTDRRSVRRMEWLHELAQTQPHTLELAQRLSGAPHNRMRLLLSGILLCHASDAWADKEGILQRQGKILMQSITDCMQELTPKLSNQDRDNLLHYIKQGDPGREFRSQPCSVTLSHLVEMAPTIRNADRELSMLLAASCFLAQRVDPHAHCAVRILLALNPMASLEGILIDTPHDYLMQQLDTLCKDLPGGPTELMLGAGYAGTLKNQSEQEALASRYESATHAAIKIAQNNRLDMVSNALIQISNCGDLYSKERITSLLFQSIRSGTQELQQYLESEGSLADVKARLKNIDVAYGMHIRELITAIGNHTGKYGWNHFGLLSASAVLIILPYYYGVSNVIGWNKSLSKRQREQNTQEYIRAALEEGMDADSIFEILGRICDSEYDTALQEEYRVFVVDVFADWRYFDSILLQAPSCNVFGREIALRALMRLEPQQNDEKQAGQLKAAILSFLGDPSTRIQGLVRNLLKEKQDWAQDYQELLLKSKKAGVRLMAAQLLVSFGDEYHNVLRQALESEKSVKVADVLRAALGEQADEGGSEADSDPEALAARIVQSAGVRKLQWLLNHPLPILHLADGTAASETRRSAILLSYSERKDIGISETAARLCADVNGEDLKSLAHEVYELWMEDGAASKHKWVLSFAAIYGGASMTAKLRHAIGEWPQHSRGAIACDAVRALVLSPDPAALLTVDSISQKFKFRQIKNAAAEALKDAAAQLGITPEQLADRIVPDLGFSQRAIRVFDYGPHSFTVTLTPEMTLRIQNDAGKVVKSMPAPGKTDDEQKAAAAYSDFKELKKQIRTTVASQKTRLEAALSALRCWDVQAWRKLFVQNPIMHQFAISLIWGIYEDQTLKATFRYMEDGSFNTVDEEEYTLPQEAQIGLVHPVELDDAALAAWRQQLEDYEITQSIQQLDRPIYRAQNPDERRLECAGGRVVADVSLFNKLLSLGWYRGSVLDGGGFYTFYREDEPLGIGVELNFSGSYVGCMDEKVTVYDALFYRAKTVERGSYVYDEVKLENALCFAQVPPRYYSEIVYQLELATASSTETQENWKESSYRYQKKK